MPKHKGIATLHVMVVRSRDLGKLWAYFYPLESSLAVITILKYSKRIVFLTVSAHVREGYSSLFSVCANNIWELTPLQPLKYAPNGRRPYFIGFKCADFFYISDTSVCFGLVFWDYCEVGNAE